MKYDSQVDELKKLLPTAKNIVIGLPANCSVDHLAAGLALYLSLEQRQKEVNIVTEGPILVGHTNLFGVGQIQNKLPQTEGGNLTITLSGVAAADGTVPTLEKLDWYTAGTDLNLVFHVLKGQRFEPTQITPHYQGSGFDLIFVLGSATLNNLGVIYQNNKQAFEGVHIVNIDRDQANTHFGSTNIIDAASSSLSEMVTYLLQSLQLPIDGDLSTNILNGIFAATAALTSNNVSADTFQAVAEALKGGGQRPQTAGLVQPSTQPQAVGQSSTLPIQPMVFQTAEKQPEPTPSAEEKPTGEGVFSEGEVVSPEPDWLTPKVFTTKGPH